MHFSNSVNSVVLYSVLFLKKRNIEINKDLWHSLKMNIWILCLLINTHALCLTRWCNPLKTWRDLMREILQWQILSWVEKGSSMLVLIM